jgi:murein DD-endopeptidase MepM/ murein hydrolase activator NlpD
MKRTRSIVAFFVVIILLPIWPIWSNSAHAQAAQSEVERLQGQIAEKNARLKEIEKEIAQYEASLKEVGAEKNTLQKAINELALERKKVQADIQYTENKISSTDLEINKLTLEIGTTEEKIATNEEAIGQILRSINKSDQDSFIEILLNNDNLAEFWSAVADLETVKDKMADRVAELSQSKTDLEGKRVTSTKKRDELVDLKSQYSDQHSILVSNSASKAELLSATKNEEAKYQAMLKDRQAAKEKLAAEVQDIESQLKFILDPNTIPTAGTAVFRWPLDKVIITQYFGYTKFALQSGAYKNNMHNGIDLGAPVGTKIYAPLSGTVRATGNTDLVPGCYSWGKWALVDHPNGLTSLFAHMSQIAVSPGQKLNTGDIIGYVGATGYATGPHLHFTVYATDAVQVLQFSQFKSVTSCGAAMSPFAAIEGYLNPLDYLPSL